MRHLILFLMLATAVFGAEDVKNGATDVITYFVFRDQTTGVRDTGVTIANLEMYYVEDQAAESADVFVGAHGADTDAHTDGECIHVGHGLYRVDWPDAAFDGGVGKRVQLTVVDGDAGAFTETLVMQLDPPGDATAWNGTAVATPTVAGVPEVDLTHMAGGTQTVTDLKDFADAGYTPGTNSILLVDTTTTNTDMLTAAAVNTEVDTALDTAIPASPTKDSVNDRVMTGIIDTVESQRGFHTRQGDIFYVDPVNGDTHANGNRGGRSDPYLTIQDCHDNAVTAWAHDLIILVAGDADSSTTHTVAATTTISKAYTFIRGPGRDFIITRTGNGDTIAVTAPGFEISGVQINTAATGSGDGIDITDADFVRVHHCWLLNTRGDGIHILRGDNTQIHHNHFQGTGVAASGQGVHIVGTAGSSNDTVIHNNHLAGTVGDSILIEDGTTNDTAIHHNQIHNSSAWGVNIGASSTDALIHDNFFAGNVTGNINDGGTDTVQANNEQWATDESVWDEVLTGATHNIASSSGRRLREHSSSVIISGTSPDTGGTANTAIRIELDGDASATDGAYDPANICIVGGTGSGQSRQIWEYDGTNKFAYINRDWKVVPDNTSEYVINGSTGNTHVNEGLATGGGASSITLNTLASGVDDTYIGQIVFLAAGVGQDQAAVIIDYDQASKVATVERAWETQPTSGTVYAVLPMNAQTLASIMEKMFSFDAAGVYGDESGSVVDQIADNARLAVSVDTTVATSNTTTSFTLTAGTATDDAYNDMEITVTDADGNTSTETRRVSDWTSGRVVTVDTAFSFTPAVGDVVVVERDYLAVSVSGGDATEAKQDTMLVRLAAIMSKAAADPSIGTYNVATDSLEAQQENPQGPPIID